MKVFITGASGFIGSHLTKSLIQTGHDVMVLATPRDNLWRIQDTLPNLNVVRGTIQNVQKVEKELHAWQPQACIHLAWYAKPGKYLDAQENITSLQGSLKLLKILINCGCEQFVGAGTCAEYEMIPRALVETDKTKPETLYAATKLSFQLTGEQIAAQCGLKFAWGRIFQLYGPQEDLNRLIPSAIHSIQKNRMFLASLGEQIRDYLHVTDVASAFSTLLENKATGIFNICSSQPITIRSILDTISKLLEQPGLVAYGALPYRQWEPMFICGSNDKLKQLGWAPKLSLSAGLEDLSRWMQNQ